MTAKLTSVALVLLVALQPIAGLSAFCENVRSPAAIVDLWSFR
jgi:hypothetical protein